MGEQARLQASRNGYRGHVTRLFSKIDEMLSGEFDNYSATLLNNAVDQLSSKMDKIKHIDDQLIKLYEEPSDIEAAVMDAEDLYDNIMDKIARARRYIELQTTVVRPSRTPSLSPVNHTQDGGEQSHTQDDGEQLHLETWSRDAPLSTSAGNSHEPTVSQLSVTAAPLSTATTSLSAADSSFTPMNLFNAEVPNTQASTVLSTHTASFPYSGDRLRPPPLIPSSSISISPNPSSLYLHRPFTSAVYAPEHLYTPQPSSQAYRVPASTVTTYMTPPVQDRRHFADIRLPKLTLPTFSGDPLDWLTFWDSFYAAIHTNPNLSGVQKFSYLKAQLEGDAARTIAGLPLTEGNYTSSITLLEDRYGQRHKIIDAHIRALRDMPSPSNSLSSLRIFHDSVESHIRGLTSLGKSETTYGELLVPTILDKLPIEIQRNLAREHSSMQWILSDLMVAILKEIRILECGQHNLLKQSPRSSTAALSLPVSSKGQFNKKQSQDTRDSKRTPQCAFCKGPHPAHSCPVITDFQERLDIVKERALCYNCLARHRVSQCPSKFRCRRCKKKHHTSLCNSKPTDTSEGVQNEQNAAVTTPKETVPTSGFLTTTSQCEVSENSPTCLLKTAVAPIIANGFRTQANILFDEGAQRSFISLTLSNELHLTPMSMTDISVASFGTTALTQQKLGTAIVEIETDSGELIPLSVLVVPSISAPIQNTVSTAVRSMPHLRGLKLAQPVTSEGTFTISLLIGTDYYWTFIQDHIVRGQGPTAQQSKLGYLLSGPLPSAVSESTSAALLQITSVLTTNKNSVPDLQGFWSVEAVGTNTSSMSMDSAFLQSYQRSSITQSPEGPYIARFPWKEDRPHLPSNITICKKRTQTLVNKLRKTPQILQVYDRIIREQEERGFIERVYDDATAGVHYLPHHPVKKESATTPIRVVYDCSCHGDNSPSLNDCLMIGPPFLNNLCAILLRFRIYAFALSTDIEKAFLHVKLHTSDRDFTRFFWPVSLEATNQEMHTYRFTVVPFGSSSSPFMLGAVLNLHLSKFDTAVARDMRDNVYVDNVLSGCHTEEDLLMYYTQSRDIMGQAKFNLRSWSTNSNKLKEITKSDKTSDTSSTVGLLGLRWNTLTDTLSLATRQIPPVNTLVTKRDVLQTSSQMFDPLGWVTPVTIKAKILLQEIWQTKLSWDEPLPTPIKDKWIAILADLEELPKLTIQRAYFTSSQSGMEISNMFVFADASMKAYGAVVYLNRGEQVCLAMSKTRVAPIKATTLPRLELMAAVTASRLAKFVHSAIPYIQQVHFWTDSQIVLHWIHRGTNPKPFIDHRVREICTTFPEASWSFTPSDDNPADLLTRGISTSQLQVSELWTQGPHWLLMKSDWPTWTPTSVLHLQTEEDVEPEATHPVESSATVSHTGMLPIIDVSRHSSFLRTLNVTAYVFRWLHNVRKQQPKLSGPLTSNELASALRYLVKSVQRLAYQAEFAYLLKTRTKCPPLVRQLRLFLDDNQLIRCGGRIHNAPITELSKFPFLIPSNCRFSELLIMDTHKKLHHGGVSITVTALRQTYWIPSIRQCVRKVLRRCVRCNWLMGKPYRAPDPPPLPKVRVTKSPPFTVTGVDFTGALYVKAEGQEKKVYICLFTCAATRAVHLEVVGDLTVETFLLAFRRFSSRKSLPRKMISDNASTYLAAADELRRLFESETLKGALEVQSVTWDFIPKRAPWYGGFWERMIGLTKQAIKKTLGRAFITLAQLETVIVEVEAMLNDRPLTYVSSNFDDPEPLTPSHLLYGRRVRLVPYPFNNPDELDDPDYLDADNMRKTVNKQTRLIEQFWTRWRREYLTSLRQFNQTSGHNKQVIRQGDVVIVHDDKPRTQWRLAVVETLITGNDNLVRAANIRMGTYRTSRPIVKLYPLEVSSEDDITPTPPVDVQDESTPEDTQAQIRNTSSRPQRSAAVKAIQKMSEWTKTLSRAPEDIVN